MYNISMQETLEHVLEEGAASLNSGGVIALPTDTIYGIAASVNSQQGIERLYEIKGRQRSKPIAICVSDLENVDKYVKLKWFCNSICTHVLVIIIVQALN